MKIYFAADHAGFEMKNELLAYVRDELGYETEDCGAFALDEHDDFPDIVAIAARKLSRDAAARVESRAIVIGGSGQGEAMAANRFRGVRCAVFYGEPAAKQTDADGSVLDVVRSTRLHNDANALSIGARFISTEEAKDTVKKWLETGFSGAERHAARNAKLDELA